MLDATDIKNDSLKSWIDQLAQLCEPSAVHWCDGSEQESATLIADMVARRTLIKLYPAKRPRSYLCRSDPSDVARVEDRTFICTRRRTTPGPTNNWMAPSEMKARMHADVRRLHARAHPVRDPVQHGPPRLADRPHRRE